MYNIAAKDAKLAEAIAQAVYDAAIADLLDGKIDIDD